MVGLQWSNIDTLYENFRFSTAIWMCWLDYLFYMLLALYLDHVWPSRYGSKLPPWFCLMPSYWNDASSTQEEEEELAKRIKQEQTLETDDTKNIYEGDTFEDVRQNYENVKPSIRIRDLRKHYVQMNPLAQNSSRVVAVDGIDLDIYQGEVFCLLGHNGLC